MAVAAISLASAAWTVGSSAAAVRWGLVIAGYAAVLIATATLGEANGALLVAAGIAALALLEAVLGVHAVAFHALPQAERLGRVWRPAGTFEYPPALALLQVGALPVLSSAIGRAEATGACRQRCHGCRDAGGRRSWGGRESRLALALAGMLLATLVLWPPTGRRSTAVTTVCCVVIGGLAGRVVLEASVGPAAPGVGWGGAGEIAALALAAGSLRWILPRARVSGAGPVVGLCFAVVALAIFASISGGKRTQRASAASAVATRRSDFLHGRRREWSAAIETALERPFLGAGAGAYYAASLRRKAAARSRFAHNLPLELAVELGVVGLLLALAIYAAATWTICKALHTPALWLLAPLVVAFLVSNLFDWTWQLAGLGSLWAAAGGALLAGRR